MKPSEVLKPLIDNLKAAWGKGYPPSFDAYVAANAAYVEARNQILDEHAAQLAALSEQQQRTTEMCRVFAEHFAKVAASGTLGAAARTFLSPPAEQPTPLVINSRDQLRVGMIVNRTATDAIDRTILGEGVGFTWIDRDTVRITEIERLCSICGKPINGGTFVGTGDGSMKNGGSFAHAACYDTRPTPASPSVGDNDSWTGPTTEVQKAAEDAAQLATGWTLGKQPSHQPDAGILEQQVDAYMREWLIARRNRGVDGPFDIRDTQAFAAAFATQHAASLQAALADTQIKLGRAEGQVEGLTAASASEREVSGRRIGELETKCAELEERKSNNWNEACHHRERAMSLQAQLSVTNAKLSTLTTGINEAIDMLKDDAPVAACLHLAALGGA